jgi:hypothetical protein
MRARPAVPAPLWDSARIELHAVLRTLSPKLAGVYRRAIGLVEEVPPHGEELIRVALIGHCLRELMNRLPDVLKDVPGMLRPTKPNSNTLRGELLEILATSDELSASGDFVAVPGEIVVALQRFASAVKSETARSLEKDSVAVTQSRTSTTPAVQQWTAARNFFMDFVHLDAYVGDDGDTSRLPADEEILAHLVIVEAALRSRLFGFFQSRRELDRRLARINEVVGDGDA